MTALHDTIAQSEIAGKEEVLADANDVVSPSAVQATGLDPAGIAWRCFHCDEVFADARCAAEHFGTSETDGPPGCVQQLTEGEGVIIASRREWQQRAAVAEAEAEQAEYLSNQWKWDINSKWRGCWSVLDVWHRYEDIEGRMLAAETALSAAPRWLAALLRRRAETLWHKQQRAVRIAKAATTTGEA